MAWTEQCKIVFKQQADYFYFSQKGRKNLSKVLKKLSKESGVPYETLKRWYYEKEEEKEEKLNSVKNDTVPEPTENKEENKKAPPSPPRPTCIKCKIKLVELDARTGKPKNKNNKYYGLCPTCRHKAKIINDAIILANEEGDGEWTICPECNHHFLIPEKGE